MKRILACLLLMLLPVLASAQTITMQEQGITFDFPESWLVVKSNVMPCSI